MSQALLINLIVLRWQQRRCLQLYQRSMRQTHNVWENEKDTLMNPLSQSVSCQEKQVCPVSFYSCDWQVSGRAGQEIPVIQQDFGKLWLFKQFQSVSPEELRSSPLTLQQKYHVDLEEDFLAEVSQFQEFVYNEANTSAVELLKLLRRRKLQTVSPKTDIALHFFLTIPVTNSSGERYLSPVFHLWKTNCAQPCSKRDWVISPLLCPSSTTSFRLGF